MLIMDDLKNYPTVNVGDIRQKALSWEWYQFIHSRHTDWSMDEIKTNYRNYLEQLKSEPNYKGLIEDVDIEIKD